MSLSHTHYSTRCHVSCCLIQSFSLPKDQSKSNLIIMQGDQREDVPRIHLDSVKQWEHIKLDVRAVMHEIAARYGNSDDNEGIDAHLNRVRIFFVL